MTGPTSTPDGKQIMFVRRVVDARTAARLVDPVRVRAVDIHRSDLLIHHEDDPSDVCRGSGDAVLVDRSVRERLVTYTTVTSAPT